MLPSENGLRIGATWSLKSCVATIDQHFVNDGNLSFILGAPFTKHFVITGDFLSGDMPVQHMPTRCCHQVKVSANTHGQGSNHAAHRTAFAL